MPNTAERSTPTCCCASLLSRQTTFIEWAAEQQKPAAARIPESSDAKAAFESLACVNCHAVRGTAGRGKFGPDLTHLMSRQTLAAGVLTNTAQESSCLGQ